MEKIKVKEYDRYRDGGTVVYEDQLGRLYYQWWPFPRGAGGRNDIPEPWVKELSVELDIVESF